MSNKNKCPVCGDENYECVDTDYEFNNNSMTCRHICYCEKCDAKFDIISTYTLKNTTYEVSAS